MRKEQNENTEVDDDDLDYYNDEMGYKLNILI